MNDNTGEQQHWSWVDIIALIIVAASLIAGIARIVIEIINAAT